MAKKMSERKEAWFRIIVAVISGVILSVWSNLVWILLVLNWLITIFSGTRSKGIAEFCEYWNTEMYKFARYMTFVSNKRPFPFTSLEKMSKFN
jgi:hypothetical protein